MEEIYTDVVRTRKEGGRKRSMYEKTNLCRPLSESIIARNGPTATHPFCFMHCGSFLLLYFQVM